MWSSCHVTHSRHSLHRFLWQELVPRFNISLENRGLVDPMLTWIGRIYNFHHHPSSFFLLWHFLAVAGWKGKFQPAQVLKCHRQVGAHGGWVTMARSPGQGWSWGWCMRTPYKSSRKKNLPNHGVVSIPIKLTWNLKKRGFMGFPSSESPLFGGHY